VKYVAKNITSQRTICTRRLVRANGGGDFSANDGFHDVLSVPFHNKELLSSGTHELVLDPYLVKIRAAVTRIFHASGRAKHYVNEERSDYDYDFGNDFDVSAVNHLRYRLLQHLDVEEYFRLEDDEQH
ncbi:hypothetical protein HDU76_012019, partial [Blyttiomyces sp. JEL0837]